MTKPVDLPGSGTFIGAEHRLPMRVYYEDTDAAGIVYYANYLKFVERGRTEMMRAFGVEHREMADRLGIAFAVRRAAVDYRRPARLDDALVVKSRLADLKGATMTIAQVVCRAEPDGTLSELVLADVQLACMTLDGRAARIPDDLRRRLRDFMAAEGEKSGAEP